MIAELNERSREIFRKIVDAYMLTGEPVGSRTLSRRLSERLSPATIRNVMADLEEAGLLFAPHASAGRLPTEAGLRLFVDGLLEVGNLGAEERQAIEARAASANRSLEGVLNDVTETLSGLSQSAGVVVAPVSERPLRHVEFVQLGSGRVLVVTVNDAGMVENRAIELPIGMSGSTLVEAGNYLTARLGGRTFGEMREQILAEISEQQGLLDELARKVVEAGLATWSGSPDERDPLLLVKGHAHLLGDVNSVMDLERIRGLFDVLETKRSFLKLLERTQGGEGVRIFIGAENELFSLSGCSMIIAPYRTGSVQGGSSVVGAIGVLGPSRMNYSRIIPMVDHTARVVSRLLGGPDIEEK